MSILLSNLLVISSIGLAGGGRHLPPIDAHKEVEGGHYALELDGVVVGWVTNLKGGETGADVVEEKLGSSVVAHKHVGNVKYEDISFRSGLELSTKFYDWIKAALAGDYTRHSGAIIETDLVFRPVNRLEFTNAQISEICIPAADADSKELGWFTFRISPETTKPVVVKGAAALQPPPVRKAWISSNYRLTLDGIDCTKVAKIGGLNIRGKAVEVGTLHVVDPEVVLVNPPLDVTVPPANASQFDTWRQSFVIAGGHPNTREKTGQIDFLAADMKTVMCTLNLTSVGITSVTPEKGSDGKVKSDKVQMFFEKAKLTM